MLLRHAVYELADHLGHSLENPISLHLLCLEFMIPFQVCADIYTDINKLLHAGNINQPNVYNMVEETMIKHFPSAKDFGELSIRAFIKAFAKCLTTDLQQFIDKQKRVYEQHSKHFISRPGN